MFKCAYENAEEVFEDARSDDADTPDVSEESEGESESETESEIDYIECMLGNPLYSMTVFDDILLEKYLCDFKDICPNIENWAYNRKVDQCHVDAIYSNLKKMKHPHLIGAIKCVMDKASKSLILVDGQHRIIALTKLAEEDETVSVKIEVDVYYIDDIRNNDDEILDLFMKANNNRNVSMEDIPEKKIMEVVEKMIKRWPNNIKTTDGNAYKPNITKRDLYNALKEQIKETPTLLSRSANDIFKSIEKINTNIRLKPIKQLFGREETSMSKSKKSQWDKAKIHGFFLNLDLKSYGLEMWIKQLAYLLEC